MPNNTTKRSIPNDQTTLSACEVIKMACHNRAFNNGWWCDINTGEPLVRPVPEMLCLIHSEVSEALEGFRKDLNDDHLPNRSMLEVELADAVIRIFDMAGGLNLDIAGALVEKLNYNDNRTDHKLENRKLDGGKKI